MFYVSHPTKITFKVTMANGASSIDVFEQTEKFLNIVGLKNHTKDVEREVFYYIDKYVTTVIEDALKYSSHAGKKFLDEKDLRLSIELQQEQNHASPPCPQLLADFSSTTKRPLHDIESAHSLSQSQQNKKQKLFNFSSKQSKKGKCTSGSSNEETTKLDAEQIISVLQPYVICGKTLDENKETGESDDDDDDEEEEEEDDLT